MTGPKRVAQLVKVLPRVYLGAHCELAYRNPRELLIATILSAQCTDKRINMMTPALFTKYKTAADYRYIAPSDAAPAAELERYLKSALGPDQKVVNGATFVFRTAA